MATADEYRQFAKECLRWATEVAEDERQAFLDMARDWTLAAMRLEGILIPERRAATAATIRYCRKEGIRAGQFYI
jgi:hypothetical protein